MPLSYHDRHRATRKVDHVLVAPAGRVEAIVVGPPAGAAAWQKAQEHDRPRFLNRLPKHPSEP